MINKNLKEDWLALLKINKEIITSETPENIQEMIKIPFTPIKIDGHLLYYLSQYLYPKFINDQKNVLEIIISDYDIDNIAFDAFLYNTSRLGIYDSITNIPKGVIHFKQKDMDNLEQLFINIQNRILDTNSIRIASVRFIRRKAIDLINRFYENLEKYTMFEFLTHFFDLIQRLVKEELLKIYPEPNIVIFLKSLFILIGNLKISKILKEFLRILPLFNQSIIFYSKELNFTLNLQKLSSQTKPSLKLALSKLNLDQNPLVSIPNKKELSQLKQKLKSYNLLILQFESLVDYFLEVSELRIPPTKDKIKLLFQKLLFAFTKFGSLWKIFPRPKIYHPFLRFLLRLFSFNFNLSNISYWSIPDFFYHLVDNYLGLNFKLAFVLTDAENPTHLISLEFHDVVLLKVLPINHEQVINTKMINSLNPIWNTINSQHGFHAMLLKIDVSLIRKIFNTFIFKLDKFGPFSLLSIIRMLKQSKFFDIYPRLPPFQLIKNKNSLILLKKALENIVDHYEF